MFPVYSVTHVPGLYPALRSVGLLNVLQVVRLRGPTRKRGPLSQALSGRRFPRFVTRTYDESRLATETPPASLGVAGL